MTEALYPYRDRSNALLDGIPHSNWVADPYNLTGDNPFAIVGGTSLSAPSWAGLIVLANQGRADAGKATLNSALRAGLGAKPVAGRRGRFVVKARPMGLQTGIDPASLNKLADDLEADSVMAKAQRTERA